MIYYNIIMIYYLGIVACVKGPHHPPHLAHFDEAGSFFWTLFLILKKGSQKSPLRPRLGPQNGPQNDQKSIKIGQQPISISSSVVWSMFVQI